ncbi:hypothetical protein MSSAC_2764 [Methanosarcina siciliae C2J]|uniref:Uncharacterized protein n=1 Tax=Methanosarcina siciliae C2J TaxID=1434118 RepID=A0A0E3PQQ7_9EURY|nr:hypothetical protein [Methanosarcina siciliae]AKB37354.1 hypothetical protein MSSAC_2764 [Methanosarcina siciliae C2J]
MNISDIPLRKNPSHGSVKRVSRITEDWLLMKLGIQGFRKFSSLKKKGQDLKQAMFGENPDLMIEFLALQDSIGEFQTIMLVTSWNLQKMLGFEEDATEDEYQNLLKRCIEALGGTAADFFGSSNTGSSSREREETKEEILEA